MLIFLVSMIILSMEDQGHGIIQTQWKSFLIRMSLVIFPCKELYLKILQTHLTVKKT